MRSPSTSSAVFAMSCTASPANGCRDVEGSVEPGAVVGTGSPGIREGEVAGDGRLATARDVDRRRVQALEQPQDDVHAAITVRLAGPRHGDGLDLDLGRREEEGDRHEVVRRDIGIDEQGSSSDAAGLTVRV